METPLGKSKCNSMLCRGGILFLFFLMLNCQLSMVNGQGIIAESSNRVIVPITAGRNIPYTAFSGTIRVEASTDYSVSVDADWLSVEKEADGLRFTASANTGIAPRSATITCRLPTR